MLLLILRALYTVIAVGAIATFCFGNPSPRPPVIEENAVLAFFGMVTVALSLMLLDVLTPRKRIEVISAIYFGLLIGVLLAYLFNQALAPLFARGGILGENGEGFAAASNMLSIIILPYLCITFLMQTKDQFRFVIPYVEFSRELKGGRPMVLDSSALIDGRVADVVETHIVDSEFLVPQFILQEVQDIADSHDKIRRSRGRRGLDVLRKLQQDPKIDVRVVETSEAEGRTVDQRLVEVTKQNNGRLVTNDVNLNKLASVQGVDVINLNDVANALKPKYLPGEHVRIRIMKEGEGAGQGIGYLDDGTMVVVEQGTREMGNEVDTIVTSVLQNSAGRMIFSRLLDGTAK
ncbi:MAG: PIN/TRAM domain-containing protein [Planctomycetaceae bacterium]|nr:PIN/TRAM domain-containing protein [Planctomycetaceae bacterium]MCA9030687.1 PIN/TRAM domain-containing protein [Planctomycetaceae bacterium]MCA9045834.1 PIN/TRAM domain-containing protein [Planctomycetaceae bacterium]MCB9949971.1 PIN/TRAM domain-containing protein [Planctomycetaceae bacterium]